MWQVQNDSPYEQTSQKRVHKTWPSQYAAVMSAANSGSTIIAHRSNMLRWQTKLLIERGKAVTWTHLNRALCGHSELWKEDTVIPPNIRIWLSNTAASFHRTEFSHLYKDLKTCNTWKRIFICNKNILKCNNILWWIKAFSTVPLNRLQLVSHQTFVKKLQFH